MNVFSTVANFYKEGGMFMHVVLVIAVLIVSIVIERCIVIGRATDRTPRKMIDDLVRKTVAGDLAAAGQMVVGATTPLRAVGQAMLEASANDEKGVMDAGDDAAALVLPDLTSRLGYIAMLANSATLIGLLGTITGLITAISGVGVADAAQRSAYLSAGISEALHTTAFGLMIAIPSLLIHGWLNARVEGIASNMERLTIRLGRALDPNAAAAAGDEGGPGPKATITVMPMPRDSGRAHGTDR